MPEQEVQLALLGHRIAALEERVAELSRSAARRSEIEPIQKLVYGMVSAVMLAVLGGVLALVLK